MGRGVPFGMAEIARIGKGPAEAQQHIVDHVRIGVLVNRDSRGRMGAVYDAKPVLDPAFPNRFVHLIRQIRHALALGINGKLVQHGSLHFRLSIIALKLTIKEAGEQRTAKANS